MTDRAPAFRLREIELYERPVKLRLPFRFGVVTLTECPQAFVRARIELADGSSHWGASAEMMAPKWFDKNLALSNEDNFDQLRGSMRIASAAYLSDPSAATAFGFFARHYDACLSQGALQGFNPLLASYGPALVDRAVLDALCRAQGISFYRAIQQNVAGIDDSRIEFAQVPGMASFFSQLRPADRIEARHTVGLLDAITEADLKERVDDGLPETLEGAIREWGHRYFKLKVSGQVDADIDRLEAIAAVLDRPGQPYFVSLDGNEQYDSAGGMEELVSRIRGSVRLARLWKAILFIEQPINRKVALDTDIQASQLGKPVIVDESDGELRSFTQARRCGYSGISSKTCKGFYKSLLNAARCAAWNREEGMRRYFMSAEDLTTQAGLSVQQDLALVNLLGIGHVERNGHYYVNGMQAQSGAEQQAFLDSHPDVYERSHGAVRLKIRDGRIDLSSLDAPGFASSAMPGFDAMKRLC